MKPSLRGKMPLVLFISFLVSCAPELKISGVYSDKKHPVSFIIREDSTFSYRYKFEFAKNYSSGHWTKKGRKSIALKSGLQNKILFLNVQEDNYVDAESLMSLNIGITIPEAEKKYYQCSIFINDSFFIEKNFDSIGSIIISKPISSVFFKINADERIPNRFLDTLLTEKYFFKSESKKNLKINILWQDSLFNYKVFNNEVLKLTHHGVKFYSPENKTWVYLPRIKDGNVSN